MMVGLLWGTVFSCLVYYLLANHGKPPLIPSQTPSSSTSSHHTIFQQTSSQYQSQSQSKIKNIGFNQKLTSFKKYLQHKLTLFSSHENPFDSLSNLHVDTFPTTIRQANLDFQAKIRSVKYNVFKTATKWKLDSFFQMIQGKNIPKKKVLILMSDTGGGHRASAQALDQALQEQFPGRIQVEVMDIWTNHAKWPYNNFVPAYRFLAKNPILWRAFYAYGSFFVTKKLTEFLSWRACYQNFQQAIESSNPDYVVSVHPLCNLMPMHIIQNMNQQRQQKELPIIPFVTVVTDLGGAHITWFEKNVDALYVPSNAVKDMAIKCGVPTNKIIMKGLPIRPTFWKPSKPKEEIRKDLSLAVNSKTVLLMGGGDGVGGLKNIAIELSKRLKHLDFTSQLIVICGHNKHIFQQLSTMLPSESKLSVLIKGFVNNIDEYMSASDCLITKAGPGTIAESMIRGLPLVLSSYLPGQEYGNVPYVVNGGFGVYTGNKPKRIAEVVSYLFHNEDLLTTMSMNAKKLSHPEATLSIARDIGESLLNGPMLPLTTCSQNPSFFR